MRPTRASLLTGRYGQRIGHAGGGWNDPTDYRHCLTLGQALQAAGYHTMMAGKWQGKELPADLGFDRSFALVGTMAGNYFAEVRGNPMYLNRERWSKQGGAYTPILITDFAVQFLEEALARKNDGGGRQPFFLYLSQTVPHWPLHAPADAIAPHRDRYLRGGWDEWRQERLARQIVSGLAPSGWRLGPFPDHVPSWNKETHKP